MTRNPTMRKRTATIGVPAIAMTIAVALFIAPFPPHLAGTHGGARVTAHTVQEAAARHEVALA
jgi:hypothetical protein